MLLPFEVDAFDSVLCSTCAFGCASVCASGGASSSKYKVVFSTDTDLTCGLCGTCLDATLVVLGFKYEQPCLLCLVLQLFVSRDYI